MDTFSLRLPWWPILRPRRRNTLVRMADRVEAVVVLLVRGTTARCVGQS